MRRVAQATHALFALISYTQSAVLGLQNPTGSLLNSSFGVPGNQSFDYVIVGGGTAGLVLAHRLSENSVFSVAVIEAGGFYEIDNGNLSQIPFFAPLGTNKDTKDYNPLVDWGFATVPQEVTSFTIATITDASEAHNWHSTADHW
jgi:choline dehydrogenase